MGTNYYAVTAPCENPCDHCGRSVEVHICKSLSSFRGWVDTEYGYDCPLGDIRSWQTWKTVLRSTAVVAVRDEYGQQQDVEAFIADVEQVEKARRRRQFDWMTTNRPDGMDNDWLDPDGFSFYGGEFS